MIVAWLAISGAAGPLFGQLSTVQKNDNTKFLPASAESQRVSEESAKFQGASFDQFPALAFLIGNVDASKLAAANAFFATLPAKKLVDADGKPLVGSDGTVIDSTIASFLIPNAKVIAFASAKNDALLASKCDSFLYK